MANCFVVFLLLSWQICRLGYQAPVLYEVFSLLQVSRHIYTSGIPEELSVYTMATLGSGPDSSQHLKLRFKALICLFLQCQRNFNFVACSESGKIGSKEHFKLKMVKIPLKKKVREMIFRFL